MLSSVMVIQGALGPRGARSPGAGARAGPYPARSAAGGEGHATYYGRVGPRGVRKSAAPRLLVRDFFVS